MKLLITLVSFLAVASLTGCGDTTGNAGGLAGTGLHGGVDATATADATNPSDVKVTVGGHINFRHAPLTMQEKIDITASAIQAGGSCARSYLMGDCSKSRCDIKINKRRLTDRISYKYRAPTPWFKPLAMTAFDDGYSSVIRQNITPTPTPGIASDTNP